MVRGFFARELASWVQMAGKGMQIRGGTRGGQDQFDWDDVKVDKHRENYLGLTSYYTLYR